METGLKQQRSKQKVNTVVVVVVEVIVVVGVFYGEEKMTCENSGCLKYINGSAKTGTNVVCGDTKSRL